MTVTIVCPHCEQVIPATRYYEHLVTIHDEEDD